MKVLLLIAYAVFAIQNTNAARGCDPRIVRSAPRPIVAVPTPPMPRPLPTRPQQPVPASQPLAESEPIWDLPGDKMDRPKTPLPPSSEVTGSRSQGLSERLMQAGAARQSLLAHSIRLTAKQTELLRWDLDAQEKFQRVFGTTEDSARLRVLDRLDQEIVQTRKLVAALTENMNMELYFQTKRKP